MVAARAVRPILALILFERFDDHVIGFFGRFGAFVRPNGIRLSSGPIVCTAGVGPVSQLFTSALIQWREPLVRQLAFPLTRSR